MKFVGDSDANLDKSSITRAYLSFRYLNLIYFFQGILYNMLHDQHRSFLRTLIPPITEVPDLSITRWHADFDLESVNDVDTTEFPTKPDVIKLHTAKDVFTASR